MLQTNTFNGKVSRVLNYLIHEADDLMCVVCAGFTEKELIDLDVIEAGEFSEEEIAEFGKTKEEGEKLVAGFFGK